LNVLIFEFICGGGMASQTLPASLLKEGQIMLQALLKELKQLPDIRPIVLLDSRCELENIPESATVIQVDSNEIYNTILSDQLMLCDVFWPIAPETDSVLESLREMAETANKTVLISSLETLAICKSKYQTATHLEKQGIPVIPTELLTLDYQFISDSLVIKRDDGAGCDDSHIIRKSDDLTQLQGTLGQTVDHYIVQPLLKGSAWSLSCLFNRGEGWLICCNQQIVSIDWELRLQECQVNAFSPYLTRFKQLVNEVAKALPGLWGYVGIDLLITDYAEVVVVEINPRLTTSYAGIYPATGINVAKQVLNNLNAMQPDLTLTKNHTITIHLNQEVH
jgi:tyramine---L-glutamate ligase